jgi:50S ribosomal protein L16 3-hydroxylase
MAVPAHLLGDVPVDRFLSEHWQKRPLLIRQAIPGFHGPLSADELAGLALEDEVESRIVLERGRAGPWELRHGPFTAEDFTALPPGGWSLLVQGVDQWVPAVAELRTRFRFIPSWRVDDVMVSYAPAGGSVGAHYDNYDVFLLQGAGRRRWRIGGACEEASPRVEGTSLRILRSMDVTDEWVLEPGDMLYLPPRIAHHGIAESEDGCLTYSIGFRAPSVAELLTGFADFAAGRLGEGRRYADPDLAPQDNPGAIGPEAIARVRALLTAQIADDRLLGDWFGGMMTEPKTEAAVAPPGRKPSVRRIRDRLAAGATLRRNDGSRFAFIAEGPDSVRLFADGIAHPCTGPSAEIARLLCDRPALSEAALGMAADDPAVLTLLAALVGAGSLRLG